MASGIEVGAGELRTEANTGEGNLGVVVLKQKETRSDYPMNMKKIIGASNIVDNFSWGEYP